MATTCRHGTAECALHLPQATRWVPRRVSIRFALCRRANESTDSGEDIHEEQHAEISGRRNPCHFSVDGDDANWLQETKRRIEQRSEWENRSRILANGERWAMAYRRNEQHEKRSGKAHRQVRSGSYRRARTNLQAGLGCRRFGVARRGCDLSGAS